MTGPTTTREQWLAAAVDAYRPVFVAAMGETIPTVRATIGWTSRGLRSKAIGQCWYPDAVADAVPELFVVPTLTDAARILDVLAHELVHVVAGPDAKHGPEFKRRAVSIGLTGRMTATTADNRLAATIASIIADIGPYPGATITPSGTDTGPPKQSTRMLKVTCPDCGYVVRTTRKWLDVGTPKCPCGTDMESEE